ncbi:MAG TPA: hypothetical protein DCY88_29100 [Cyanobacteria bacterium UBA11372]|nr:hypothetical protein [Cyanobacteria bacterium UBA11372]HBE51682.1 hypothetical protein [Cyanobacteria bacterium UBA11369]
MVSIYQLVKETLQIGCLSLETENKISKLFESSVTTEDIEALITLQDAVAFGYVDREAHKIIQNMKVKDLVAVGSK